MAKKIEEPKKEEAPEWIVSFTDMTSLEMAFFIVLMSFSTPRQEKLDELQGSIEGAFGFLGKSVMLESQTPPKPILQGRDLKNPNAPSDVPRFRTLANHELRDDIMKLKDQSGQELEVDRIAEGWRIRIGDAVDFHPGEAEMSSASFRRLGKVAEALRDLPFRVVVVGYAGRGEGEALGVETRVIDLALRRAVGVAERLVGEYGLKPDHVAVAGYGSEPGETRPGRVELILADQARFSRSAP
jgi:flagellar motor protein MotB